MRPEKIPPPALAAPAIPGWLVPVSIAGLLIYLAILVWGERHSMAEPASRIDFRIISAVLGLSLLNYGLRFLRWHRYLKHLGHRLAPGRHLLIYVAGFALTVSPAKAGESVRALYLRQQGVPMSATLATLFIERVLDMLAVALLALALVLTAAAPSLRWLLAAGLGAAIVLMAFLAHPALPRWLLSRSAAQREGRVGSVVRGFAQMLLGARELLRWSWMTEGLLLGLVAWAAEGYGLYLILQMFGVSVTPAFALGAYSLSLVVGALSFLPGGVGGAEAALTAMLVAAGISLPTAVASTALCRLATLWFAVALGLAAMLALRLLRKRPR